MGCSDILQITGEELNSLQKSFPFLKTKDLDLAGLNFFLAQQMSPSRPWRSHLHPGTDVTVRSSMNALIRGCRVPDLGTGPLQSTSADFTSIFMTRVNGDKQT